MTMHTDLMASGTGWRISRFVCTALPSDRALEERHERYSISMVQRGSFQYDAGSERATLVSGSMLLGNHGICFRCRHDHGGGDICLSFQFDPACWEEIVSGMGDVAGHSFTRAAHPPDPALGALQAKASMIAPTDPFALAEEMAFRVAGTVVRRSREVEFRCRAVSAVERRHMVDAAATIAERAGDLEDDGLSLLHLARGAGMTRYRFLRLFRQVIGMTPHQYVLLERIKLSARRLLSGSETISEIAYASGFGDLSTFNRQFRRAMGQTPGAFRRAGIAPGARIRA